MEWVAVGVLGVVGLLAGLLTLVSMPGSWLLLLTAVLCWWLVPGFENWWWIAGAGVLAILGEIAEFFSSVVGAKAGGSGKHGAWGALIGGIAGAIVGTVVIPIPLVGTIAGGVIGAGVLAAAFEKQGGKKTWRQSSRAGTGAAVGKLASTVLKSCVVFAMACVLLAGGIWEALDRGTRIATPADMLQPSDPPLLTPAAEPAGIPGTTETAGDADGEGTDAQVDRPDDRPDDRPEDGPDRAPGG